MGTNEQELLEKLRQLPQQQLAEVEDFVEFLMRKARRRTALERLLAIAPALQTAGAEPMSEAEIAAEVRAVRESRRARAAQEQSAQDRVADRS